MTIWRLSQNFSLGTASMVMLFLYSSLSPHASETGYAPGVFPEGVALACWAAFIISSIIRFWFSAM